MNPFETLVYQGGAAKALDDKGKVGGYLVLFGGPDQTDASQLRDYFTGRFRTEPRPRLPVPFRLS